MLYCTFSSHPKTKARWLWHPGTARVHTRLSVPWHSVSVQSVYGAKFVRTLLQWQNKKAMKSDINKQELNAQCSNLFPGTALSYDFLKKCFEFPGNLSPLNLLILCTLAAFDRCGLLKQSPGTGSGKFRSPCPPIYFTVLSAQLKGCMQYIHCKALNDTWCHVKFIWFHKQILGNLEGNLE